MNQAPAVELSINGLPVVCTQATVFRPESSSVEAAHSAACALFAVLASLPGCEVADWLPDPCELPEVGSC